MNHEGELKVAYMHSQDMGQLVGLLLTKAVPSIGDKHNRDNKLAAGVYKFLEGPLRSRDGGLPPDEHPINVKQQAKVRLELFWIHSFTTHTHKNTQNQHDAEH